MIKPEKPPTASQRWFSRLSSRSQITPLDELHEPIILCRLQVPKQHQAQYGRNCHRQQQRPASAKA